MQSSDIVCTLLPVRTSARITWLQPHHSLVQKWIKSWILEVRLESLPLRSRHHLAMCEVNWQQWENTSAVGVSGNTITEFTTINIPGFTIDQKLDWINHVDTISTRVGQTLDILWWVTRLLTPQSLSIIYKAQIRSVIDLTSITECTNYKMHYSYLPNYSKNTCQTHQKEQGNQAHRAILPTSRFRKTLSFFHHPWV